MNVAAVSEKIIKAPKTYTLDEYLAREERAVHKHKFYNGQIIRIPGSKFNHNEIAANVITALNIAVRPLPKKYRVITSDQKIYIKAENKAVYPDALIVCEKPQYWEDREDLVINPLLIVEVASRSTRKYDRGEKFMLYCALPSFKEYVLIEQESAHVEAWFRERETTWDILTEKVMQGKINLRSLGVEIPLEEIYRNIEFKISSK